MKRGVLILFSISLSLVLFNGCFSETKSSSEAPCADPAISDTTGTYYASDFSYIEDGINYSPCSVYLYIDSQKGNDITGSTSASCTSGSSSSTFTGKICGSTLSGQAVDNSDSTVSQYSGSITATSVKLSFTGSDAYSSWSGSGTLYKQ
jgi:hypothetical protein